MYNESERTPLILREGSPDYGLFETYLIEFTESAGRDSEQWFPGRSHDLVHHTLGLCGEVGEFANIVKKIDRGTVTFTEARGELIEELSDALVYFLTTAHSVGLNLLKSYVVKRAYNEKRFGHE